MTFEVDWLKFTFIIIYVYFCYIVGSVHINTLIKELACSFAYIQVHPYTGQLLHNILI